MTTYRLSNSPFVGGPFLLAWRPPAVLGQFTARDSRVCPITSRPSISMLSAEAEERRPARIGSRTVPLILDGVRGLSGVSLFLPYIGCDYREWSESSGICGRSENCKSEKWT